MPFFRLVFIAPEVALIRWIDVTDTVMHCAALWEETGGVCLINVFQAVICIISVQSVSAGNIVLENLRVKENALVSLRSCDLIYPQLL